VLEVSATRGDGIGEWADWIDAGARSARRASLPVPEQRGADAPAAARGA
jgi:hypothetical protein